MRNFGVYYDDVFFSMTGLEVKKQIQVGTVRETEEGMKMDLAKDCVTGAYYLVEDPCQPG